MTDNRTIGAFGHVTSAVVCAASSFSMSITDPTSLLEELDVEFFRMYKDPPTTHSSIFKYVEPQVGLPVVVRPPEVTQIVDDMKSEGPLTSGKIESKIVVLEDFIDTDAVRNLCRHSKQPC